MNFFHGLTVIHLNTIHLKKKKQKKKRKPWANTPLSSIQRIFDFPRLLLTWGSIILELSWIMGTRVSLGDNCCCLTMAFHRFLLIDWCFSFFQNNALCQGPHFFFFLFFFTPRLLSLLMSTNCSPVQVHVFFSFRFSCISLWDWFEVNTEKTTK